MPYHRRFLILALLAMSPLAFWHCSSAPAKEESMVDLRTRLNAGVGRVLNLDTLLCKYAYGASGEVYFDDMTWKHLSSETRKHTVECLDKRKHLRVKDPASATERVRVWTARIDEDYRELFIGWLYSDCIACDMEQRVAQFKLETQGKSWIAAEIPPEKQWK